MLQNFAKLTCGQKFAKIFTIQIFTHLAIVKSHMSVVMSIIQCFKYFTVQYFVLVPEVGICNNLNLQQSESG